MQTIDKTKVDEIIDALLGNNDLTASPEVWYGLHQIKKLLVTEIVRCGECEHFRKEHDGEMWCGISKGHGIDKDFFCGDAERRTECD